MSRNWGNRTLFVRKKRHRGISKVIMVLLTFLLAFGMLPSTLVYANDASDDEALAVVETSEDDATVLPGETNESMPADELPATGLFISDDDLSARATEESGTLSGFYEPDDLVIDDQPVPLSGGRGVSALADVFYNVSFTSNGSVWGIEVVAEGSPCNDHGAPPLGSVYWPTGAVSFRGWSTDADTFTEFDFSTAVNSDFSLYAFFSDKYLVKYKNCYDNVVWTEEYSSGQRVQTLDTVAPLIVITPPGENLRLDYWYVEADYDPSTPPPARFRFGDPCTKDMTLVPWYTNEWFVFFISEGTQVPYQLVDYGSNAVAPASPSRLGYTFSHWSKTAGGPAFDFAAPESKVTDNLTLYAVWTAQTVNYTIVYWIERPNFSTTPDPGNKDHYIFAYSETASGLAGSISNVTGVSTAARNSSTEMTYSTFQQANNAEIKGNGTTVVNVYSKRDTFTITFNLNNNASTTTMLLNGVTYYGDGAPYVLTVKYELDISDVWPAVPLATFNRTANYRFTNWSVPFTTLNSTSTGTEVWYTKRLVITENMLPRNPGTAGYTVTGNWDNNAVSKNVVYYIEALTGQAGTRVQFTVGGVTKDYIEYTPFTQNFFCASTYNLGAKTIAGVTYVGGNSNAANTTDYRFYYDRNVYTLGFNTMGGSAIAAVPNVKYEQGLAALKPSDPTRVTDGITYTFKGWYLEAEYHTEFDFTAATMPAANLTLFARWQSNEYTINFYTGLTRDDPHPETATVSHNGYLVPTDTPYQIGDVVVGKGTFDGWYFYIGDTAYLTRFSHETPITEDMHLHAVWKINGYTVRYVIAPGTGDAPVDTDNYYIGRETRVATEDGFLPPAGQVFIGWMESNTNEFHYPGSLVSLFGDAVFVAQYGDAPDYVEVIYHSNYPGTAKPNETITWNVLKNSTITLAASSLFSYPGTSITAWTFGDVEGYAYDPGPVGTFDVAENTVHFYARWVPIYYTVTYQPGTTDTVTNMPVDTDTHLMNSSVTVKPETPVRQGYTFTGWLASFDSAVYAAGAVFNMPGENAVLTAQWSQDQYTVIYAPGTQGTWSVASETKTGLVYGDPTPPFGHDVAIDRNPGYVFDAWTPRVDDMVTGSVTYTALWRIDINQTYLITYRAGGGGRVAPGSEAHQLLYTGANSGSSAEADFGYRFINWTDMEGEEVAVTATYVPTIHADATFRANFEIDERQTYTIKYEAGSGGSVSLGSETWQVLYDGEHFGSTASAAAGYYFVNWTGADGAEVATTAGFVPTAHAAATYRANFAANTDTPYTVQHINAATEAILATDNLAGTTGTTVTALPRTNIVGYSYDPTDTREVASGSIAGDGSLVLKLYYKAIPYEVAYDPANGMARIVGETQFANDVFGIITAIPTRTGYVFGGWLYNGALYFAGDMFTMPANNVLFVAQWTPRDDIIVTFDAQGGTAADPATKTVTFNAAYGELATTSRTGYTFQGWYTAATGGSLVTAATIVTTAEDHTLYAQWTPRNIVVTFDSQGGTAAVPATKTVLYSLPYGQLATTSREGYVFVGWFTEANGGTQVTDTTIVATDTDHTLYAQWQKVTVIKPDPTPTVNKLPKTGDSLVMYLLPIGLALIGSWLVYQDLVRRKKEQTIC